MGHVGVGWVMQGFSVLLRTQATFLLSVGTNIIIMPLRSLYREHLVIIFDIIGNITQL